MRTHIKISGIMIAFLAISSMLQAQKCKYNYDKVDEITGKAVKGISVELDSDWEITLHKEDKSYCLELRFEKAAGQLTEDLEKGSPLVLKLANGELINLVSKEKVTPKAELAGFVVVVVYRIKYDISPEDIQKMSEQMLTFGRVEIQNTTFDISVKVKEATKFKQAAVCILQ
ncbi:MAG: hypothetical protein ACOXZH_05885 [Bacteroidales bacterium]|jgi:hypothetical protein|nr:hypothetical protein [Bacteroidales bacterium]